MQFVPSVAAPAHIEGEAYWFAFRGNELLVMHANGKPSVPVGASVTELGVNAADAHYLGAINDKHCFSCELDPDVALPPDLTFRNLRSLFFELDDTLIGVAGRAFQIKEWDRTHRFCGACGARTQMLSSERARECARCRLICYPRISPVVMVLVRRGRELLLTRKPGYAPGRYTVVAGFVEAGETLEAAVARETAEETNVNVENIRYFACQPWPFPHSLVIAFHAQHAGGEVRPDGVELEDARWFHYQHLPDLPEPVHVSRKLIDDAVNNLKRGSDES